MINKKKLRYWAMIFTGILSLICMLYPFANWIIESSLTSMQMFLKYWYCYLMAIVLMILFMWLESKLDINKND